MKEKTPNASRSKMTQQMLNRVARRSEPEGMAMDEIIMDIAQDPKQPPELRFKAANSVANLVYPKASSVEVQMDVKETLSKEQLDARLNELLQSIGTHDAEVEFYSSRK